MQKININMRVRIVRGLILGLAGLLMSLSLATTINQRQVLGLPSDELNFQARLLGASGAIVPDGDYHVEFKIYDAVTSSGSSQGTCTGDSNCLWVETRSTGNLVTVKNGYLSVYLGSVNNLPSNINWSEQLWLTMNIGGDGGSAAWDGEMAPRLKLTAVPFAFRAEQLAKTEADNDRGVLGFDTLTANRNILLPDASGTVCLQTAAACGFVSGDSSDFIQNGTVLQSNANFNIGASSGVAATITGAAGQNIFVLNQNGGAAALTVSSVGNATLAGDLAVNGGDITSTGALNISPGGAMTLGATTQTATVQGSTVSVTSTGAGNDITLTSADQIIMNATTGGVDMNGSVAVGDTATVSAVAGLNVGETYTNTDTCSIFGCHGSLISVTANNVTAGGINGVYASVSTAAAAFTLPQAASITAGTNGAGAGSTITDNYGLYVQTQTAGTNDYGIYVQGADTYGLWVDSGATRLDGTLELQSLGAADTDEYLCRNSSDVLSTCSNAPLTSATAFMQGGNSFTATAVLGTNDAYNLELETGGTTRLTIDTSGNATLTGNLAVNGGTLSTTQTSFNLLNTTATSVNAFGAVTALNIGAATGTTITPGGNLTFAESNSKAITITSDLTSGARTADVLAISQANNATNNSTGNLLELNNADTGSTVAVLQVTQAATGPAIQATSAAGGTGLTITGVTTGTGINANTVTTGNAVTATGITSGAGLSVTATTTGRGLQYNTTNNGLTSGSAVAVTGAAAGITADYTGAYINVNPTRTLTAATTRTDSGNFLNLTRSNTVNNAGATYNITGALANLQSNCTQTAGTCTDSSNILSLNQQYASSTGSVLRVQGAGTGNLVQITDSSIATDVFVIADGGNVTGTGSYVFNGASTDITTGTNQDLVLLANGTGQIVLNDTTQIATLGTADSDTVLCRNSSNQFAACSSTFATSANAFLQNGNSFGTGAVLGTNDAYSLELETGGITRLTIDTSGDATLTGDLVVQGTATSSFAGNVTISGVLSAPHSGASSERFGANSSATGSNALAVGNGATANGNFSMAIGTIASTSTYVRSIAMGYNSQVGYQDNVAIGYNTVAGIAGVGSQSVAIGSGATTSNRSSAVAIGYGASVTQAQSVALGSSALADQFSVAIGQQAQAGGNNTVAIGQGANYEATPNGRADSVAIGQATLLGASKSIALGQGATTTATNQMVIGSSNTPITNIFAGNGVTNATPFGFTLQSTGGNGTNVQGADITIASGRSTGNLAGGSVLFQTSDAGTSSATLRNLSTKAIILGNGNFGIGDTTPVALFTVGTSDAFQIDAAGNTSTAGTLGVQGAATFNGQAVFNSDVDITLNDSENVSLSSTITGTTSVSAWNMLINNNTSSGTQNLALLQNGSGSGATEALLVLDNADIDTAVGSGIVVTSAAGGIVTGIDVSDADITYALLFGANDIVGTNFGIIGSTGTVYIGSSTGAAGALVLYDGGTGGSENTVTLNSGTQTGNYIVDLPDNLAANDEICLLNASNCSASNPTLQNVYDNDTDGSNVVVNLNSTDGSILFRDNGTPLGGTLFAVQDSTGASNYLSVAATGLTTSGDLAVNGGDITSTGALNITPGGAMTLGVTAQTATLQGSTTTITSTGAGNDITLTSADQIILNPGTAASGVDINGVLAIGNNATPNELIASQVNHTYTGSNCGFGCYGSASTITSNNVTSGFVTAGYFLNQTAAAGFTLPAAYGAYVQTASKGAGSTITKNVGVYVGTQTVGTNNAGIVIGETSGGTNNVNLLLGTTETGVGTPTIPTGNYSIYNQSTDQNYFAGNLGIGDTSPVYALTVGNGDLSGISNTGAVGIMTSGAAATADLSFGGEASRTVNVLARTGNVAGSGLTISAGAAGTGASAFAGGVLTLQGGAAAGTGNANGGNVLLTGGTGTGTGTRGLVVIDTPTIATSATQNCASTPCAITPANVNNTGVVLINATIAGVTATLPDPAIGTSGRLMYVTNVGSNDFTLSVNGGGTGNLIAMKPNTTATMIWNSANSDWTAAGASSSTDLQSAYNNTLTSAGGAELVLNAPGGSADGLTIRNNATTPISGGVLEVQSSIGTNLFSVNNLGTELAANGGAETSVTFTTNWTAAPAGGTVSRTTTSGNYVTGQAGVQVVTTTTANTGVRNNLSGNPVNTIGAVYQVSFTAKSTINGTPIDVQYSRDGGTSLTACTNYGGVQTLSNTVWTKITCTITIDSATAATNPDLIVRKTDGSAPTIYIDNLSFMRNDLTTQPSNVQIGGGINGGPITLFTLDRSTAPPVAAGDTTYLGSMYYDTTSGRIQCYEEDGWGACGSAPNNEVNLLPEFPGAVLNGSGIGTMVANFCSDTLNINDGSSGQPSICSTNDTINYYQWTSPQASMQTYSIIVTHQLPASFKNFDSDSTVKLTGRTDNTTNGSVTYQMYRDTGSGLSQCGSGETTVTTSANTWQTVEINGNEATGCSFSSADANGFVVFKINVKAQSNANVYVGNLSFITTGQ